MVVWFSKGVKKKILSDPLHTPTIFCGATATKIDKR